MRKRSFVRGAAALVVIVLIVLLAAAGYWFYNKKAVVASESAFDLAAHLPKSAHAAWMINLRGQVDIASLQSDWQDVVAKIPEDERKKMEADVQEALGVSLSELAGISDGRAAMAVVVSDAGKPGAVGLIGLKDAATFEKLVKDNATKDVKPETIGGVSFIMVDGEGGYGHDATWVYLADSKANAEMLIAAAAGKDTLSTLPSFLEARAKVDSGGSLSVAYWDIARTVKTLQPLNLPYTDAQTYQALACLQYAVSSVDFRSKQSDAFLKVLDDKGQLASKLLTKGSVTPASFGALTRATDSGYALDIEWTFNSVLALMAVSPESRQTASMAGVGILAMGNPFISFDGEIATANNGTDKVAEIFTTNFGRARSQGQLTACKSNLKNIGTALEMWSTDNYGKYPDSLQKLTPDYLKTIPQCPAAGTVTYRAFFGPKAKGNEGGYADFYYVECAGSHHKPVSAEADLPAYSSVVGLIEGTSEPTEDPDLTPPSLVVTANIKDVKLAHGLMLKAFPEAGPEPKSGEEKSYPVPEAELKMTTGTPPRLVFSYGPDAAALLDTKDGTLAEQPRLKEALAWGGDGIIYADYLNLAPAVEAFEKALPAEEKSKEAEVARVVLGKLKSFDLEGASALAARPDGLHWRAYGSSGGMVAVGAVGAAILVPNFIRARAQGQLTACKSNLKNIGTALEMWSTDNSGQYPDSLEKLTPDYLRSIPECPAAAAVTYKAYFGPKAKGNSQGYADYYYVECAGHNHTAVSVEGDYPAYNGVQGLIERGE